MKKAYLILLVIITVASIIFGSLYHIGGFFRGLRTGNTVTGEVVWIRGDDAPPIRGIEVETNYADIEVSMGETTRVIYSGDSELKASVRFENGILHISQNNKVTIHVGVVRRKSEITLELAGDIAPEYLQVRNDMGDISARQVEPVKCEMHTAMGDVFAKDSSFDSAALSSNMGDVTVKDCFVRELEAYSDMGDIKLEGKQDLSDHRMELGTSLGEVKVFGTDHGTKYFQEGDAGSVTAKTDLGSVKVET